MNLTVLIDLDDTLLANEMSVFQPAYFKLLSSHLPEIPTEKLVKYLWAGTQAMIAKNSPASTLAEIFNGIFYPGLGIDHAEYINRLNDFYLTKFPQLKSMTSPVPGAVQLIEWISENQGKVAIATNPLFPKLAILERLRWAELPPEKYPFQIIPSFESFHFAKPNPNYYAEFLAQLGWVENPVVMIGNDLEQDILPAMSLGIPVYWITNTENAAVGSCSLNCQGAFSGIQEWLARVDEAHPKMQSKTSETLLALMNSTPAALDTFYKSVDSTGLTFRPKETEWNLTEIICHLRDVDQCVNIPRLEKINREDNPFLPGIDTDDWARAGSYAREDSSIAFQSFIRARNDLIALISNYSETEWQRMSRHAIFGPTKVIELVEFIAVHDQNHIRQAKETLATFAYKSSIRNHKTLFNQ